MVDEEKLLRQIAQGDRAAFLRLYDLRAAKVHGLSLHILRDLHAAEEVTQDTFMRVWERAGSYHASKGKVLPWLLTITRRLAIDRIRSQSRRIQVSFSIDEDWLKIPDPDSETEESRWRSLAFALRDLPQEQRQSIELAYYQGMSHSQIAELIGVPLGTVKTRIRLGMQKLRKAMGEGAPGQRKSEIGESDVG
jgi:RNA polymerase sigma-70 factor (ECF subfamily)